MTGNPASPASPACLPAPLGPPCSGSLVGDYGARWVFGVTAAFPLLVTAAAVTIPEQRIVSPPKGVMRSGSGSSSGSAGGWQRGGSPALPHARHSGVVAAFKNQAALLWATGKQPGILWPAVFVFAWQVGGGGAFSGGHLAAVPAGKRCPLGACRQPPRASWRPGHADRRHRNAVLRDQPAGFHA